MNVQSLQTNYLVQHQIHFMQKAYECNKCVCMGEESLIFQSSFSIREPMVKRSHMRVVNVTDLSVEFKSLNIIRVTTPGQNVTMQMEWFTAIFQTYSASKYWREN